MKDHRSRAGPRGDPGAGVSWGVRRSARVLELDYFPPLLGFLSCTSCWVSGAAQGTTAVPSRPARGGPVVQVGSTGWPCGPGWPWGSELLASQEHTRPKLGSLGLQSAPRRVYPGPGAEAAVRVASMAGAWGGRGADRQERSWQQAGK